MKTVALKVLGAIAVLWAAATFTFFVQAALPGDRATLILNQDSGQIIKRSDAELAPVNEKFGFDDPIYAQYVNYVAGLAQGDLGTSYRLKAPVTEIIGEQIWPTIFLTIAALIAAWVMALALTLLTAKRGRIPSALGSGYETFTAALPHYWLGVILLVVFAIELQLFPVEGGSSLIGLVLPALTLGIPLAGFLGQVTRDEFEKVLDQPFVTSARARGMGDFGVRWRHALRHAVLPAITLSGWAIGALFSGAVIAEIIFARQGIGNILVTAANMRDIPLVSGIVMLVALIYVVANLLVDLAYRVVDPRIEVSS
ncbi:ABC transporter permease [Svornostia abyssi]|uniref:ABC transporter permease n=1 Tax=Svornostia abyssi TaxID=2898438 RepID=A0ABY5PL28_9ACTN|nr:ABC transporter permease [Parviterribacteraceae bacterium J379]